MNESIARIRIDLRGIRPPIWRRVDVPVALTLHELHEVIQAAFGWAGGHLHEFTIGTNSFAPPEYELNDDSSVVYDSRNIRIRALIRQGIRRFGYTYDFGDDWVHKLLVEDVREGDGDAAYPALIGGRRRRPPENIGGVHGFGAYLALLRNPADPEYEETVQWYGTYEEDGEAWKDARTSVAEIAARRRRNSGGRRRKP